MWSGTVDLRRQLLFTVLFLGMSLPIYTVFAFKDSKRKRAQISKWVLGVVVVPQFFAVLGASGTIIGYIAYFHLFGDKYHPIYSYYWIPALLIALGISTITLRKLRVGRMPRHYLVINVCISLVLLSCFALSHATRRAEEAERFYPTAREAAEQTLRDSGHEVGAYRLVEDPGRSGYAAFGDEAKTFTVMGADEPIGRICVSRHGASWTFSRQEHYRRTSSEELARAKESLQRGFTSGNLILREIVRNFPGTPAAEEAQRMLNDR